MGVIVENNLVSNVGVNFWLRVNQYAPERTINEGFGRSASGSVWDYECSIKGYPFIFIYPGQSVIDSKELFTHLVKNMPKIQGDLSSWRIVPCKFNDSGLLIFKDIVSITRWQPRSPIISNLMKFSQRLYNPDAEYKIPARYNRSLGAYQKGFRKSDLLVILKGVNDPDLPKDLTDKLKAQLNKNIVLGELDGNNVNWYFRNNLPFINQQIGKQ